MESYDLFVLDGDFREWDENMFLPSVRFKQLSWDEVKIISQFALKSGLQVVISPARRGDGQS